MLKIRRLCFFFSSLILLCFMGLPSSVHGECSDDSSDLAVASSRVALVTNIAGNRTRTEVAVTLTDAEGGAWTGVSLTLLSAPAYATITDSAVVCEDIAPGEAVECTDRVTLEMAKARRATFVAAVAAGTALTFSSPQATETFAYQPEVVPIDTPTLARYQGDYEDGDETYALFLGHSALVDAMAEGQVLIQEPSDFCTTFYGEGEGTPWAWRITRVEFTAHPTKANLDQTRVYREQAGLSEVYEAGRFVVSARAEARESLPLAEGVTEIVDSWFVFNDEPWAGGSVLASGSVHLASLEYDLDARIRNGDMDSTTEIVSSEQATALTLMASADALLSDSTLLGATGIDFGTAYLGAVPITLDLSIDVFAGAEGSLSASTTTSATHEAMVATTWVYDLDTGSSQSVLITDEPFAYSGPALTDDGSGASVRAWVGPTVTAANDDGSGGSEVTIAAWMDTTLDPAAVSWWSYAAGYEVTGEMALLLGDLAVPAVGFAPYEEEVFSLAAAVAAPPPAPAPPAARVANHDVRWGRAYSLEGHDDRGWAAVGVGDGGTVFVGSGPTRSYLVKTDALGNPQWGKSSGNGWSGPPVVVARTSGGGVVLAGHSAAAGGEVWLAWFSSTGGLIRSRTYDLGGTAMTTGLLVIPGGGGSLGVVGGIDIGGEKHGWFLRLDSTGVVQDAFGYANDGESWFYGIQATHDGGVSLMGSTTEGLPGLVGESGSNALVVKLDGGWDPEWQRILGTPGEDFLQTATSLEDGSILAAGQLGEAAEAGAHSFWLARFAADGSLMGQTTVAERDAAGLPNGDTPYDRALAFTETAFGSALVGSTGSGGDQGAWLLQFNTRGNLVRHHVYDGVNMDRLYTVSDMGNGLLMAGESRSYGDVPGADSEVCLLRVGYDGGLDFAAGADTRSDFLLPDFLDVPTMWHGGDPFFAEHDGTGYPASVSVEVASQPLGLVSFTPAVLPLAP